MVTTKLNLSMTEPQVRQIYAKQGDTGRVLDISLDQTPEDGTLRILRPDGVEVTSEAVTGGEISESGETVSFESLTEADVTELTVGIEPVQDLSHGDPSPTNICPITGHDEVEVTRTGKNLADISNAPNATNVVDSVDADGKIHFKDVTARWSSTYIGKMFVKAGETYTISGGIAYGRIGLSTNTSHPQIDVNIPDITVLSGGDAPMILTKNRTVNSFTANYTGYMYVFYCSDANYAEAHGEFSCYVFCNVGSTATAYEPYQGSTYTTSLGQTVYGGTLDMVSGVLTVDKVGFTPLKSQLASITNYQRDFNSTNGIVSVRMSNSALSSLGVDTTVATLKAKVISTLAPTFSGNAWNNVDAVGKIGVVDGLMFDYHYSTIGLSEWTTDGSTTVNAFYNTFGSSLFIVAPLASPQTYQLTPQQIKTLVGTNNVWASSGDIVSIKFTYGGLLSELPSDATSVVGKCYCDVEQNGVSSMPFTLNVKKNERQ